MIKRIESCIERKQDEYLSGLLNDKFEILSQRLVLELDLSLTYLNSNRMNYNDFRYTKLAAHLMFFTKLSKFVKQKNEYQIIKQKIKQNQENFNCFLQSYLF